MFSFYSKLHARCLYLLPNKRSLFFYLPAFVAASILILSEVLPNTPNCPDCGLGRVLYAMFIAPLFLILGGIIQIFLKHSWRDVFSFLILNSILSILLTYLGIDIPQRICWKYGSTNNVQPLLEILNIDEPNWKSNRDIRIYNWGFMSVECSKDHWRFVSTR